MASPELVLTKQAARIRNELDRLWKKLTRRDIGREEREKLVKRERELNEEYRELRKEATAGQSEKSLSMGRVIQTASSS